MYVFNVIAVFLLSIPRRAHTVLYLFSLFMVFSKPQYQLPASHGLIMVWCVGIETDLESLSTTRSPGKARMAVVNPWNGVIFNLFLVNQLQPLTRVGYLCS